MERGFLAIAGEQFAVLRPVCDPSNLEADEGFSTLLFHFAP